LIRRESGTGPVTHSNRRERDRNGGAGRGVRKEGTDRQAPGERGGPESLLLLPDAGDAESLLERERQRAAEERPEARPSPVTMAMEDPFFVVKG